MKRKNTAARLTALGLASAMILSNAAVVQAEENTGEPVTLTVAVQMNEKGEYSSDNYAIRYIEEHCNVKFDFV